MIEMNMGRSRERFQLKELSVVEKPYLEKRLRQTAFNSSHFVWLLTELRYFESSQGYLFAYQTSGAILFVALEPLPPTSHSVDDANALATALAELKTRTKKRVTVFVGVYEPCMRYLSSLGFRGLRVGSDPFVHLEVGGPKGNKAKGIRSARNQALRHGVEIEEWKFEDIARKPELQAQVRRVHERWSESSLFKLSGFLLVSDPLVNLEGRHLFVARVAGEVVGFLITSPVRFGVSSYFEDLMFLPNAPNGCTEMLLLHAMEALRLEGQTEVSLGVVALNNFGFYDPASENVVGHLGLRLAKKIAQCFYSSAGIELNRKRYQPRRWDDTFVACHVENGRVTLGTWATVMLSIVAMLKPRLKVTLPQAYHLLRHWAQKHQASLGWAAVLGAVCGQNQYPVWLGAVCIILGVLSLNGIKTVIRGRSLLLTLALSLVAVEAAATHAVMDLLNRGPVDILPDRLTLAPFWLVLFVVGGALQQLGRKRSQFIWPLALLIPLGFESKLGHPEIFAERIFPFAFLLFGYVAARVNFEIYRYQSQKHSKDKSPV